RLLPTLIMRGQAGLQTGEDRWRGSLDVLVGVPVDEHDLGLVEVNKSALDQGAAPPLGQPLAGSGTGGLASSIQMLLRTLANMAGTGRGAQLLPRDAVLVIVAAKPLALVFQIASLSDNDLLPACPPPLAHDGLLCRFLTRLEQPQGAVIQPSCGQFGHRLPAARRCIAGHQPHPADARLDRQPAQHVRLGCPQFGSATGAPSPDSEMRNDGVMGAAIGRVSRKGSRHCPRQRPERLIRPWRQPDNLLTSHAVAANSPSKALADPTASATPA